MVGSFIQHASVQTVTFASIFFKRASTRIAPGACCKPARVSLVNRSKPTRMNVRRGDALIRPRLLLAEDHVGMRERVVQMLERTFDVVGVVADGAAFLEAATRMKPDVCVIDISLPGLSGIEAAIQLREVGSTPRLVFLTMHEDPDYLRAALAAGAAAYVVKSRITSDLCIAITEALAGRLFVSPSVPYVSQNNPGEDAS